MAPIKNYTPEQMGLAIDAVRKGLKVAEAAKKFGVPRITLYNKTTGKSPIVCTMGPNTIISKEDEDILEIWIKDMAEKHIPITKDELLDSVQRLIIEKNLTTPFTDNRPGKKWYASFLKRHPDISERTAQNLTTARDNVSEEQLKTWFKEVENYLKDRNLSHILEKPERIFNTDESAFFLNPKPGRVLAKKGDKHVYSSSGDEKDNLTVLVTGNAAGQLAPTMVVFNYERIPSTISSQFPDDWVIGRSDSGWMRGSTFFEYITNNFDRWLNEQNIERPVLFFLDGHKSHLTLHLSNFCVENGIEVISLCPNSTHLLQPMDLAVFRPLKNFWRKAVQSWKLQNLGQNLKKEHFAPVLKTALTKLAGDSIKHGFRAGGIYPYGPDYVDMSKIKTQKRQTSDYKSGNEFLQSLENKIVCLLSQEKLNLFRDLYYKKRSDLENSLPVEDLSLYVIWAHSLSQYGSNQCDDTQNVPVVDRYVLSSHELENALEAMPRAILPGKDSQKLPGMHQDHSPSNGVINEQEATSHAIVSAEYSHNVPSMHQENLPANGLDNEQEAISRAIVLTEDSQNVPSMHQENLPANGLDNELEAISRAIVFEENSRNVAGMDQVHSLSNEMDNELEALPNPGNFEASCSINDKTPMKVSKAATVVSDTRPGFINLENTSLNIVNAPGPPQRNEIPPLSVYKRKQPIIPSPFKRVLFWPGEEESTKGKKRKMKEKLPSAMTGSAWRQYHQKKEEEKRIQIEKKELRAKERQEKIILKEKLKEEKKKKMIIKKKIKKRIQAESASSETEAEVEFEESDDSYELENDVENENPEGNKESNEKGELLIGSYVIVRYEGEYFPGIIENMEVNKDKYEISTMTFSTGNTYKWPEKKDKLWYNKQSVVDFISPPVLVNKRGFYSVKETKKYSPFTC